MRRPTPGVSRDFRPRPFPRSCWEATCHGTNILRYPILVSADSFARTFANKVNSLRHLLLTAPTVSTNAIRGKRVLTTLMTKGCGRNSGADESSTFPLRFSCKFNGLLFALVLRRRVRLRLVARVVFARFKAFDFVQSLMPLSKLLWYLFVRQLLPTSYSPSHTYLSLPPSVSSRFVLPLTPSACPASARELKFPELSNISSSDFDQRLMEWRTFINVFLCRLRRFVYQKYFLNQAHPTFNFRFCRL